MTGRSTSSTRKLDRSASGFSEIMAFTPAGASAWFDIITASGRFFAQRLEADLKTQQALLRCSSPAEVMQVQADYYTTAVEHYAAESGRMLELMSGAMSRPLFPSLSMLSRGYDDVPL